VADSPSVWVDAVENRAMYGEKGIDTETSRGITYPIFDDMDDGEFFTGCCIAMLGPPVS
jgi:hypothetical protein